MPPSSSSKSKSKSTEGVTLRRRIFVWVRRFILAGLLLMTALSIGLVLFLRHAEDQLPPMPDLEELRPDYGTSVRNQDGTFLGGEFALSPVAYEELPPLFIMAFLAAEDEDFFLHRGYNARSILRAIFDNYRAGRPVQGASTMTQQVAKHFVGDQRRLERKVQELLLARKIEEQYSKEEILSAYLGGVYFGQQAWGVTMASHRYFQRPPQELNLNQMATLAGLLPAPSVFNPIANPNLALRERNRVLRRLHETGVLSAEELEREQSLPLDLSPRANQRRTLVPEAVGTLLRNWEEVGGNREWESSDLTVYMTHSVSHQTIARRALQNGIEAHDRRAGYRGPLGTVKRHDNFDDALQGYHSQLLRPARVVEISSQSVRVLSGKQEIILESAALPWLSGLHPRREQRRSNRAFRDHFEVDDVVLLRRSSEEEPFTLFQVPLYQGAFMVVDHFSGEVLASVGSYDPDESRFHRAEQACRQPGSLFKTILYAEAFAQDLTLATLLSDVPIDVDSRSGVWQPRNADRDFRGYLMAIDAFALSRNIPAVHLGQEVGHRALIERARLFGINSLLDPTPSLALGASCLRMPEILGAHSAIPRGGKTVSINSLAFTEDQRSRRIRDHGHFLSRDPSHIRRVVRAMAPPRAESRAISPGVNQLMHYALRGVVTYGTASAIPNEWPVSGKTGTSNEFDTWFVGFDPELTAAVWIGSDQNDRPFLSGEHGGTVALPAFIEFYRHLKRSSVTWPPDSSEADLISISIDSRSGLRARAGEPGRELPFLRGTEPREYAPTGASRALENLDTLFE